MPKTYMTMISMFTVAWEIDGDSSQYDAFGNHLFKVVRIWRLLPPPNKVAFTSSRYGISTTWLHGKIFHW